MSEKKIHTINPILVDVPMPITTDRLIIRPTQAGDGKAISEAKRESWKELQQWMEWAQGDVSKVSDEADEILMREKAAEFLKRDELMLLAFDKASGKLVASTGLHRIKWNIRRFEIGYWVRSSETGKGIASEITNALTRYAFGALAANSVYIGHAEGNYASQRVIEKLGFVKEGHTKMDSTAGPRITNSLHYARYNTDGLPDLDISYGSK
ncbi:MAG: GNAT family N-acetyltransferase [Micavibrio sp.]|nr:GNAT family N-acetyltransferase [Micavibrio sp.]|tara:strand:+ start:2404 stop:3033 length:630 start_codon:yes stop_codon:yes gene_type:complete